MADNDECKHTPGPWEYEIEDRLFYVFGKDRLYVATNELCDAEEDDANARLIAAAPELLEACENLVADIERYSQYPTHSIEIDAARAAIAKAKGVDREDGPLSS